MKRRKMQDSDIHKLQSHYHNFYRVKSPDGQRGTAFVFDRLTNDDVATIEGFKNTIISSGRHKHAPEIRNVRVILLDRLPKGEGVTT